MFVGGRWRDEQEWPLARTSLTPYYLHADGRLSPDRAGAAAPTTYSFDPRRPVPTIGGNVSSEGELMLRGARDQRCRIEALWLHRHAPARRAQRRAGVPDAGARAGRGGHRPPGREALGEHDAPRHRLHREARRRVPAERRLPAGLALNVADSIVRARYRESLVAEKPMAPGTPYELTIEMYPTSLVFSRGPPDPAGRLEQQLPALRREPEHGRAAGPEPPLRRRGEQRLPRPRAPVADPAAGHPRRALTTGAPPAGLTARAPSPSAPRTSSGRR